MIPKPFNMQSYHTMEAAPILASVVECVYMSPEEVQQAVW